MKNRTEFVGVEKWIWSISLDVVMCSSGILSIIDSHQDPTGLHQLEGEASWNRMLGCGSLVSW